MLFNLYLAYFETSGPTEKRKFPLGLKTWGLLLVKLETLLRWLRHRSWNVVAKLLKDVGKRSINKGKRLRIAELNDKDMFWVSLFTGDGSMAHKVGG